MLALIFFFLHCSQATCGRHERCSAHDSGDLTHRGYASPLSLGGARHARLALVGARGFVGPAAAQAGARALHDRVVFCAHAPCECSLQANAKVRTSTPPAVSR